ncbi:MAG: YcjX family protein [Hyphomicrobiaceae bacterium]
MTDARDRVSLRLSELGEGARSILRNAGTYLSGLTTPVVRLGVTGLARSGKTVFITALVRNLLNGGRLPFFRAYAEGRVQRVYLEPQPDDAVPRFAYEDHLSALARDPPAWPESTRRIGQLRITFEFKPHATLLRAAGMRTLHLDIVDYPGEWLLDLGLLGQRYEEWAHEALMPARTRTPEHAAAASAFLGFLAGLNPAAPQPEDTARVGAELFTAYLRAQRAADPNFSTLGTGRFLMPGDFEGSPLLTFFPLAPRPEPWPDGSLGAMMARRYDSYRAHVVKPFFRNHFGRLDRQIVLIDALAALHGGAPAVAGLAHALESCLKAFRSGANTWLSAILARRIDRILFAAAKADHLHQDHHRDLTDIVRSIVAPTSSRAQAAGAKIEVLALAALRSTREARYGGERLPCVSGVLLPGQRLADGSVSAGIGESAVFPGDLQTQDGAAGNFRFRPPRLSQDGSASWPHIRLDTALEFLIGDKLV